MDSKKGPEEKENGYISSYRYLSESMKEMAKIILPTLEQTRTSYDVVASSFGRLSDNVTKMYLNRNLSKELGIMADEMSQTLTVYLNNSIATSQEALKA